jgi:hypothetical protein
MLIENEKVKKVHLMAVVHQTYGPKVTLSFKMIDKFGRSG